MTIGEALRILAEMALDLSGEESEAVQVGMVAINTIADSAQLSDDDELE